MPVLKRKIAIIIKIIANKLSVPLYYITIFLAFRWADAYLYIGNKEKEKYLRISSKIGNIDKKNLALSKAISYLKKAININSFCFEAYDSLAALYSAIGSSKESLGILHKKALEQKHAVDQKQLNNLEIEFIPRTFAYGAVGIIFNLDTYIKAKILGLLPENRAILLLEKKIPITNESYLNYWKSYIHFIDNRETIEILSKLEGYLTIPLNTALTFKDKTLEIFIAAGIIQKYWIEKVNKPLLKLREEHLKNGWKKLKKFGLNDDEWFVCLHVREPGWRDNYSESESFRNADIKTYFSAIDDVVSSGGWVLRMGDPISMKPLPKMDRVIDYAHSSLKSDWMDVFCCAQCRFCIGTSSGVYTISKAFGVPVVLTNYLPTVGLYSLSHQDIFIPRLCWFEKEKRYLKFSELFSPPVSMAFSQDLYDRLDLKVIENSKEEIQCVVNEMLDRVNSKKVFFNNDKELQNKFKSITKDCGFIHENDGVEVHADIGAKFLREHSSLL